jgi:E3 ubiquitin-protein ligase DCST1
VEKHGKFHMTLTGNHTLHIRVVGTGFVAQFVRSITAGFNSNADAFVNHTLSNVHCLPQASSVEVYYTVKIVVLFLCLAAFILLDHVPKRIRRKICAFYYPKREKQRIVHLYNKLLVARIQYRESTRKNLQDLVEELRRNKEIGFKWPFFKRFPFLKLSKFVHRPRKCCFCDKRETKDLKLNKCAGCNNDLNFCSSCWKENDSKCVFCLLNMNISSCLSFIWNKNNQIITYHVICFVKILVH